MTGGQETSLSGDRDAPSAKQAGPWSSLEAGMAVAWVWPRCGHGRSVGVAAAWTGHCSDKAVAGTPPPGVV